MKIPRSIIRVIDAFQKLPGIGPKTAQRLTFYMLHLPDAEIQNFADSVSRVKKDTMICSVCKNVGESEICSVCSDPRREQTKILVVEQPVDAMAFEKTGKYKGLYHVLHGSINPLENIGPDEIFIEDLLKRVKNNKRNGETKQIEVIIATNPTMEGDATAMYINKKLQESKIAELEVTRLGMGIPTGADLEYADEATLSESLAGRRII